MSIDGNEYRPNRASMYKIREPASPGSHPSKETVGRETHRPAKYPPAEIPRSPKHNGKVGHISPTIASKILAHKGKIAAATLGVIGIGTYIHSRRT